MLRFAEPIALIGLISIVIPLVFHLLNKRIREKVIFPPLIFLKETEKLSSKARRLEDLLLFFIRIAAFLLIPLAVALPYYRSAGKSEGSAISLGIIIDNSLSSAERTDSLITVFDKAINTTLRILSSETAEKSISKVTIGTVALPRPVILTGPNSYPSLPTYRIIGSGKPADIIPLINKITISGEEPKISAATDLIIKAISLEEKAQLNKAILLIGSAEKLDKFLSESADNFKIPIILFPVGKSPYKENIGIYKARVRPPFIKGKETLIDLQVYSNLGRSIPIKIKYKINNNPEVKQAYILQSTEKIGHIKVPITIPDEDSATIRIEIIAEEAEEQNLMDNRWFFSIKTEDKPKTAIIKEDNSEAAYLQAALDACGWLDIQVFSTEEIEDRIELLSDFRTIILLPIKSPYLAEKIIDKVISVAKESARNLIIFASPKAPYLKSSELIVVDKLKLATKIIPVRSTKDISITLADERLSELLGGNISTAIFEKITAERYLKLEGGKDLLPILSFKEAYPLLLEKKTDKLWIYLFCCSLDYSDTTLPLNPLFPILMGNLVGAGSAAGEDLTYKAGSIIELTGLYKENNTKTGIATKDASPEEEKIIIEDPFGNKETLSMHKGIPAEIYATEHADTHKGTYKNTNTTNINRHINISPHTNARTSEYSESISLLLTSPGIYTITRVKKTQEGKEYTTEYNIAINNNLPPPPSHKEEKEEDKIAIAVKKDKKITSNVYLAADLDELNEILSQLNKGKPIWDLILIVVLMVLMAEALIANLRINRRL